MESRIEKKFTFLSPPARSSLSQSMDELSSLGGVPVLSLCVSNPRSNSERVKPIDGFSPNLPAEYEVFPI